MISASTRGETAKEHIKLHDKTGRRVLHDETGDMGSGVVIHRKARATTANMILSNTDVYDTEAVETF